eukprot:gene38585-41813_t
MDGPVDIIGAAAEDEKQKHRKQSRMSVHRQKQGPLSLPDDQKTVSDEEQQDMTRD